MNPTAGEQQRKEKNIEEQNLRVARSLEWKEKVEGKSGRGGGHSAELCFTVGQHKQLMLVQQLLDLINSFANKSKAKKLLKVIKSSLEPEPPAAQLWNCTTRIYVHFLFFLGFCLNVSNLCRGREEW